MPNAPRRLAGRCLCGRLAYTVEDAFLHALTCHCSICRRMTGSAFNALAGIGSDKLALDPGSEDAVMTHQGRGWHYVVCRHCGSTAYAVVREGTCVHVTLGTLADAPSIRLRMHVFVGSKAPWYDITDALPQHWGARPEDGTG